MNAEAKINERRARLRKSKNDHKVQLSRVKKELENFNNRLNSGGDESRQKQRSLQLERNIRQTEETTASLDMQLDSLDKIPEEELEEWNNCKAAFDQQVEKTRSVKALLEDSKAAAHRNVTSTQSDLASTVQKRERLQARQARLAEQHERITAANSQGLNERERRATEQIAKEREQATIEEAFHEQIANITQSVHEYQIRTNHLWQQAAAIEQAFQQQQQHQFLLNTGPITPEGELPGTNPQAVETSSSAPITSSNSRPLCGLPYYPLGGEDSGPSSYQPSMAIGSPARRQQSSPLGTNAAPGAKSSRDRSSSNLSSHEVRADYGNQTFTHGIHDDLSKDSTRKLQYGAVELIGNKAKANRAASQESGSASGSGSGSPHSPREQMPFWG